MEPEYKSSRLWQVELILMGRLDPSTLSRDEIQRLVEEIKLAHQTELDMQNQELRDTQLALEVSRDKYAELYDFAPVGLFTLGMDGTIQEVNLAGAALLGFDRKQLAGQRLERFVLLEERDKVYLFLRQLVDAPRPSGLEFTVARPDGSQRMVQMDCSPVLDEAGQVGQIRAAMSDVTALKQAQETLRHSHDQLEARLKEKEVLLREIHHRVKNSLQGVSNLIYLQAAHLTDDRVRKILWEMRDRIHAIALVHEKLYQPANLAEVDFVDYAESLVNELIKSYERRPDAIRAAVQADRATLDLDMAVNLGIIINELVSNALKHAFPDGRHKPPEQHDSIRVQLRSPGPARLMLVVADNGIGLPPEVDPATASSLGLQLVHMMAQHLHGAVEIDRRNGTCFTLTFELEA